MTSMNSEELAAANHALRAKVDELEQAHSDMQHLVDATGIATVFLDRGQRITRYTPMAATLFGLVPADIGRPLADLATPLSSPDLAHDARQVLDHLAPVQRELGLRDGAWYLARVLPYRAIDDRIAGTVLSFLDITERHRAEEALVRSQAELTRALRELEAADEAKDRFIAVLSHELRNPLASVASAFEVLADDATQGEVRTRALDIARRQATTMRQLLEDLLDVTRLRLGKLTLRPGPTTLREVVGIAEDTVRPMARERRHRLDIELPPVDVRLLGDKVRIAQVITNLLGNACKYTPPGGHIRLGAHTEGRELRIVVQDNGIGLDATDIEQVFGLFVQAPAGGEATASGLGIGLALARSIAELHGGSLRAQSAGRGQGSRFTFTLPIEDAGARPASAAVPAPQEGQRTVLIVDDNADAVWGLGTVLGRVGYRVLTAGSAAEGLALAIDTQPDALLLDIGLPDMSGLELARRIRALPWGSRVLLVALTGRGQDSDLRQSREAGFDAHLTKPPDVAQLRRLLAEGRHRPQA